MLPYLIACIVVVLGLVCGIAVTVGKKAKHSDGLWLTSLIIAACWFLFTLLSFRNICSPTGCLYSIRFGWTASALLGTNADPALSWKIVTASMIGYLILSLYFVGHAFGWAAISLGMLRDRILRGI